MSFAIIAKALAASGATGDQIAAAAEAYEMFSNVKCSSTRAARDHRYYENHKSEIMLRRRKATECNGIQSDGKATESVVTKTETTDSRPRLIVSNLLDSNNKITPSDTSYPQTLKSEKPKRNLTRDIQKILESVLTPIVAAGVIDHRNALRKKLTAMAAEGLAKAFAATGQPDAAAKMMIERGWQGFNADWFANAARGSPARSVPLTASDVCTQLAAEIRRQKNGYSPEPSIFDANEIRGPIIDAMPVR